MSNDEEDFFRPAKGIINALFIGIISWIIIAFIAYAVYQMNKESEIPPRDKFPDAFHTLPTTLCTKCHKGEHLP